MEHGEQPLEVDGGPYSQDGENRNRSQTRAEQNCPERSSSARAPDAHGGEYGRDEHAQHDGFGCRKNAEYVVKVLDRLGVEHVGVGRLREQHVHVLAARLQRAHARQVVGLVVRSPKRVREAEEQRGRSGVCRVGSAHLVPRGHLVPQGGVKRAAVCAPVGFRLRVDIVNSLVEGESVVFIKGIALSRERHVAKLLVRKRRRRVGGPGVGVGKRSRRVVGNGDSDEPGGNEAYRKADRAHHRHDAVSQAHAPAALLVDPDGCRGDAAHGLRDGRQGPQAAEHALEASVVAVEPLQIVVHGARAVDFLVGEALDVVVGL